MAALNATNQRSKVALNATNQRSKCRAREQATHLQSASSCPTLGQSLSLMIYRMIKRKKEEFGTMKDRGGGEGGGGGVAGGECERSN